MQWPIVHANASSHLYSREHPENIPSFWSWLGSTVKYSWTILPKLNQSLYSLPNITSCIRDATVLNTSGRWFVWSIPTTVLQFYDLDLPGRADTFLISMICVICVICVIWPMLPGGRRNNLHGLAQVPRDGSVPYRSCTCSLSWICTVQILHTIS